MAGGRGCGAEIRTCLPLGVGNQSRASRKEVLSTMVSDWGDYADTKLVVWSNMHHKP